MAMSYKLTSTLAFTCFDGTGSSAGKVFTLQDPESDDTKHYVFDSISKAEQPPTIKATWAAGLASLAAGGQNVSCVTWLTTAYKVVIQLGIATMVQVTGISYSQDTRGWQADAVAAVSSAAQVLMSQQAGAYASASALEVSTGSASCTEWRSSVASGTCWHHSSVCTSCLAFYKPCLA